MHYISYSMFIGLPGSRRTTREASTPQPRQEHSAALRTDRANQSMNA
jgi:hypothetical protein